MIFTNPIIPSVLDLGSTEPRVRLAAVQQITRQLAVPGFLETFREHRLTPLIYHTLTQFTRKEVGEVALLEELRRDYLVYLRRYLNQERATRHLVKVLSDDGVKVILLKGADIRHRLYEDPAARPMNDVDILISPADLETVRAILKREGYTLLAKDQERIPNFNIRFAWEEVYASPQKDVVFLDLHWEIRKMGAFYRLPCAALRAKAMPLRMNGVPLLILAPEHLLMSLCLNTIEELEGAGIQKLVDLDRVLTRLPLNWDLFLEDATVFRIQGAVLWVLREMAELRPQAVPEFVLERLAAYTPGWCESLILRREAGSLLWASLATLWRHIPLREWPAFLKGKFWPDQAFIQANYQKSGSRIGYIQHLLKRTQDKT